MELLKVFLPIALVLFFLSMISERIAEFLKHYLSNMQLFGINFDFFKFGDTTTKHPSDTLQEKLRAYRILKINIFSGILLAVFIKADLIQILGDVENPGETLGWAKMWSGCESDDSTCFKDVIFSLPGCVLTGIFLSFGSKFWHDLLDILYQIKNSKRILADTGTYEVDKTQHLKILYETKESDYIKSAFDQAKNHFSQKSGFKGISLKIADSGSFFELEVKDSFTDVESFFPYDFSNGIRQNIPIKIVKSKD